MADFILFLYDDPSSYEGVSPEQMQAVVEEYTAWAKEMEERGRYQGGQKLMDEGGRILTNDGSGILVKDGPYSETKEVIGGIMEISAETYEEAIELAKTCPHAKYGPKIEVRQVDPVSKS